MEAQTAPIRFAERAAQVKRMLVGRAKRAQEKIFKIYMN